VPPVQFAYIVTLWPGVTELADACNEDDSEEDDIVVVVLADETPTNMGPDWELCPDESVTMKQ